MIGKTRTTTLIKALPACVAILAAPALMTGCNDAQAGSLLGAGIGALAGNAIGGDSEATLIGTAVGAGAGYIIGNEQDKARYGQGGGYASSGPAYYGGPSYGGGGYVIVSGGPYGYSHGRRHGRRGHGYGGYGYGGYCR